ncbi:MAG: GtrA family protein [Oscillospiraceae bacterium]|nr:GtrA family protein [Oscillospiraceae bacterium]
MKNALKSLDARLEAKIPEIWKFIKWCIVGGFANAVDIGSYYIMLALMSEAFQRAPIGGPLWWQNFLSAIGLDAGLGIFIAFLVSITLGYIVAYILNRKVAFKANNGIALSSVIYAVNVLVVIVVGSWFGTWFTMWLVNRGASAALIALLPKPLQVVIPMTWSYPLNRLIVFTRKKERSDDNTDTADNSPSVADAGEDTLAG